MKQLTKEMKSVLTTGYNIDHRTGEKTEYWIQYGYLTNSDKYCWIIREGDLLLAKILYWKKEDPNSYTRYTEDKNLKSLIKRNWIKYA